MIIAKAAKVVIVLQIVEGIVGMPVLYGVEMVVIEATKLVVASVKIVAVVETFGSNNRTA